jgi:alkylated DNA repair dioxygenase AlkB
MKTAVCSAADGSPRFEPPPPWTARYAVAACDDTLYVPNFIAEPAAWSDLLFEQLDWEEESIVLFGRMIRVPRLSACYGDDGVEYRYSNVAHRAKCWPDALRELRECLHRRVGMRFNFVLANLYRDGSDSMGWHADDERELGARPVIASISFGAPRVFRLRSRDASGRRAAIRLESGSLLLMWGRSQRAWQHALPKVRGDVGRRINLTFRDVNPCA